MDISIKTISLFGAILLTGLSAGLFYAWEVSVIPGTKRVADASYIETMQHINRAIINPAFMLIFFGSLLVQALAVYQYKGSEAFWFLLGGLAIYAIGTIGITSFGNVPLNNSLELLDLNSLSLEQLGKERKAYEGPWNRFHTIRTICSVLAFMSLLLGAFSLLKPNL